MVISHCAGCFSNGLECSFFLGFIDAQNSDSLKLLCKDLQTLCEAKLLLRVLKRNPSPVLKRNDLTAVSPIVKKYAQNFNSPSLNYQPWGRTNKKFRKNFTSRMSFFQVFHLLLFFFLSLLLFLLFKEAVFNSVLRKFKNNTPRQTTNLLGCYFPLFYSLV